MDARQVVGVVGGGVGGACVALALQQLGREVVVFEQAAQLGRVGADVNLTPNAVRALDGLGVGEAVRETAAQPSYRISRTWDTGAETSRLEMGSAAEARYGSPQLTVHRADLVGALVGALSPGSLRMGTTLAGVHAEGDRTVLEFADGESVCVDVLVGADGIHSVVREALWGATRPEFTGVVAYRAVVPAARLDLPDLGAFTKWWGPDSDTQLVTFPLNRGADVFVFATRPQSSWQEESWTSQGDVEELRSAYGGFHPDARALLQACDSVLKSALYVRDPMPRWSVGSRTLLGDACHPMMPFMAQGAGMAIEDAVVLARALATRPGDAVEALQVYEQARRPRTSDVQVGSRRNDWLRTPGNADWVYGYDAWAVPVD